MCWESILCSQQWDLWTPILWAPPGQGRARCCALPTLLTLHEPDGGGLEFFTLAHWDLFVCSGWELAGIPRYTAGLWGPSLQVSCCICQLCRAGLSWEGQRRTTQPSVAAHPETICRFIAGWGGGSHLGGESGGVLCTGDTHRSCLCPPAPSLALPSAPVCVLSLGFMDFHGSAAEGSRRCCAVQGGEAESLHCSIGRRHIMEI